MQQIEHRQSVEDATLEIECMETDTLCSVCNALYSCMHGEHIKDIACWTREQLESWFFTNYKFNVDRQKWFWMATLH